MTVDICRIPTNVSVFPLLYNVSLLFFYHVLLLTATLLSLLYQSAFNCCSLKTFSSSKVSLFASLILRFTLLLFLFSSQYSHTYAHAQSRLMSLSKFLSESVFLHLPLWTFDGITRNVEDWVLFMLLHRADANKLLTGHNYWKQHLIFWSWNESNHTFISRNFITLHIRSVTVCERTQPNTCTGYNTPHCVSPTLREQTPQLKGHCQVLWVQSC